MIQKINYFINFKRIFLLLIIFFGVINAGNAQKKVRQAKQPFRNYRLCFGGGLIYSPLSLLTAKSAKPTFPSQFRAVLHGEIVLGQIHTINVRYQREYYNYDIIVNDLNYYLDNPPNIYPSNPVKASIRDNIFNVQYRKYSNAGGYLAPHGRFVGVGLSFSGGGTVNLDSFSYTGKDLGTNMPIRITVPYSSAPLKNTGGLTFSMGKKQFIGKKLRQFIQIEAGYELKFFWVEGNSPTVAQVKNGSSSAKGKGYTIYARNNSFTFNLIYGFAL